ncbi:hypothetical protein CTheo_1226 [Ceratobasidium theobromae]|uniref:Homeobox domain-containing protein n=1 Tax=Ceratobasidium theobromae TaxID=1582974 RepID=A0A5N5QUK6_9AGAM|nr:hypothetical protein CTheo_1226 [Ceratobasidium theobromae]
MSSSRQPITDAERTLHEESVRESGDESDVMDNIVFNRPITRRMSRGKAPTPVAMHIGLRRSGRKSNSMPPPRTPRVSQGTSSPPSSSPQPRSQSCSSQSEPHGTDEPTGMSQELAQVTVASQEPIDSRMEDAEGAPMDAPTGAETVPDSEPEPENEVPPTSARTLPAFVFDPEPERAAVLRASKAGATRTTLALPVFSVSPPVDAVGPPSQSGPGAEDPFDSSCSSIGTTLTFDLSIPASTSSVSSNSAILPEAPRVQHTPRRSARLSGISACSTVSSTSTSPMKTRARFKPNVFDTVTLRQTRAKLKVDETGPSRALLFGATASTSKGKEREQDSPPPAPKSDMPRATKEPKPQLGSLSPASEAVLANLQESLKASMKRPGPTVSAMKRHNEEVEPGSPTKRARFDLGPAQSQSRPTRIHVHPPLAKPSGSFTGPHAPIVVRGSSSPSRQQLLLNRPAGPPMRVPVGQQNQRAFPARVLSPVRTGSYNNMVNGNGLGQVDGHVARKSKSEVLIESSSPVRAGRGGTSRLPVAGRRKEEKNSMVGDENGASGSGQKLEVPSVVGRERTPPTPLETPGSPGSSTSTLIMDVPLFYQPPSAEEGTRRQREQGKVKVAAAAAAALRCLPLQRAPRRIIPDGSALQELAVGSDGQKELQRLTAANTERNTAYECVIERTNRYVDEPRPPSPTSRVRTKAQKAREMERQSRDERAQRRAARGSASASEERVAVEDEWTEEAGAGRRVRWARALVHDDAGVGLHAPGAGPGARGCLARVGGVYAQERSELTIADIWAGPAREHGGKWGGGAGGAGGGGAVGVIHDGVPPTEHAELGTAGAAGECVCAVVVGAPASVDRADPRREHQQINVWFCNRRTKAKREKEQMPGCFIPQLLSQREPPVPPAMAREPTPSSRASSTTPDPRPIALPPIRTTPPPVPTPVSASSAASIQAKLSSSLSAALLGSAASSAYRTPYEPRRRSPSPRRRRSTSPRPLRQHTYPPYRAHSGSPPFKAFPAALPAPPTTKPDLYRFAGGLLCVVMFTGLCVADDKLPLAAAPHVGALQAAPHVGAFHSLPVVGVFQGTAPPPAELPISVWQAHPLVRTRARITRDQLRALEALFAKTWFPTSQQRAEAATATGMREYSVTVWFQNRRSKAKKEGITPPEGDRAKLRKDKGPKRDLGTHVFEVGSSRHPDPVPAYPPPQPEQNLVWLEDARSRGRVKPQSPRITDNPPSRSPRSRSWSADHSDADMESESESRPQYRQYSRDSLYPPLPPYDPPLRRQSSSSSHSAVRRRNSGHSLSASEDDLLVQPPHDRPAKRSRRENDHAPEAHSDPDPTS